MVRIRAARTIFPVAAAAALNVFGLAVTGLAPAALAAPSGPAFPASRVPIASAVPAGATDEGAAPAAGKLALRVYLSGQDLAGLQALARQVSTPGSAQYGHYLTPARYAAEFGPTAQQSAGVSGWLKSCGLSVTSTTTHYVSASGGQAAVTCAVGTPMHDYRWHGTTVRAPAGTPSVPSAVSGDVLSVTGLSSLIPQVRPASAAVPATAAAAASATCSAYFGATPASTLPQAYGVTQPYQPCGYLPSQLRSAYGTGATGLTGAGVKVAVVDSFASATMASDAQAFSSAHGEPGWAAGQYSEVVPAGLSAQPLSWTEEEVMDVE